MKQLGNFDIENPTIIIDRIAELACSPTKPFGPQEATSAEKVNGRTGPADTRARLRTEWASTAGTHVPPIAAQNPEAADQVRKASWT